jgi:hypothetical protein
MSNSENFRNIAHAQKLIWELRRDRYALTNGIESNPTPQNLEELRVLDERMETLHSQIEANFHEISPNFGKIFSGE